MCGRFNLIANAESVAEQFELPKPPALRPRYNIAPTQPISVVALQQDQITRGFANITWGIVPEWAASPKGMRHFNVRGETAHFKFGRIFNERRVLIPATGFYEWQTVGKRKVARLFGTADAAPFAIAGLWDVWGEGHGKVIAAALLTTKPNPVVAAVHDRMPVILPREHYAEWLDLSTSETRLRKLLCPYPPELMSARDVGPAVNSAKVDSPECIAPAAGTGSAVKPDAPHGDLLTLLPH